MPSVFTNKISAGGTPAEFQANLVDIHNQRLHDMDTNGIDFVSSVRCYSQVQS